MSALTPRQWSEHQLLSIIDEYRTWVVYGRQGRILNIAMSLREALERSAGFARSRVVVEKLARQPSDTVVVSYEQALKVRKLLAGLEVPAIKEAVAAR
jgi:hypothetical protein